MKAILRVAVILVALAVPLSLPAETTNAVPLPTVDEVLRRLSVQAAKEADAERAFNQRYSYTRTRVTECRNNKGELKKREEEKSKHKPAIPPIEPVGRAPSGEASVAQASDEAQGRRYKRKDFSINDELLGRFVFTLVRREVVKGRPALVLTFQPADRKLPEHDLKDRFINRIAGRVWVDEADYLMVRAQLHLTAPVNLLGGLVGAVHGFTCELNRERTGEGLWFTRALDWYLDGRKLFVRETIEHTERRTEVHPARATEPAKVENP